jgi:hypothetical protein
MGCQYYKNGKCTETERPSGRMLPCIGEECEAYQEIMRKEEKANDEEKRS